MICFPVENLLQTLAQLIYSGATQLFDLVYLPCMSNSCFSHSKKHLTSFFFFFLHQNYSDSMILGWNFSGTCK